MEKVKLSFLLVWFLVIIFFSCTQTSDKSLAEHFKGKFYLGAAVTPTTINTHKEILLKHFNSVTCENQMKWEVIHPLPDVYSFSSADKIVDFALKNKMKIRGHTLVWHQQVPAWVFMDEKGNKVSKEQLFKRLEEHIKKVVGYYKGKVYAWDVINEAISDSPTELLRQADWYEIGGIELIEKAFFWAHEADPQALLFYNDYNLEDKNKMERAYNLLKTLKEKGVPIHGVGIQAHWTLGWPSPSMLEEAIKLFSALGLDVQLTEYDISIYKDRNESENFIIPPEDRLEKQADLYARTFKILNKYKEKVSAVTFWGIADDYTWLDYWPINGRKDHPLLFDTQKKPKKAFYRIIEQ